MADPVGKTILQLELVQGAIDRERSYIEIHVVGQLSSQRVALTDLAARGLSAKEVVQITHPEVVTDADFIAFISGKDGKSAFEVAQAAGFAGTQAEWLVSLKGTDGTNGTNGKSAYEIALEEGFMGTRPQWLASLIGRDGEDGTNGTNGKSNYELAQEAGFVGTLPEYLASIKGEPGPKGNDGTIGVDGKSAYELAQDAGFEGTLEQWQESLMANITVENLQLLLNQADWTVMRTLRAKGADGALAANSSWNNFLYLFDRRINQEEDGDFDFFKKEGKIAQKVLEGGFLNAEGIAYFKITDAPSYDNDPADPDNPLAQYFLTKAGKFGVGNAQDNIILGDGSKITVTKGGVPTTYDLAAEGGGGADGKSAYEVAVDNGFDGDEPAWLASLKGTDGEDGVGTDGKSAYQIAVDGGYVGTEVQWIASLKGLKGDQGQNGLTAYEIAVSGGYQGTPAEWIASLKGSKGNTGDTGENGISAYDQAVLGGYVGTEATWVASLKGEAGTDGVDGQSAYELALAAGFEGDETEWILSLEGAKGDQGNQGVQGRSAYQVALDGGFVGTAQEWLLTLEGKTAYQSALDTGFVGTEVQWIASLKGAKGDTGPIKVIGTVQGVVDDVASLPDASEFAEGDYFFIGNHVYMNIGGAWSDVGAFEGPAGRDGSGIRVLGSLPNVAALPATGDEIGDAWLIGKSMYVWQGELWQEQGQEGLRGPIGEDGPEGKSAYDVVRLANPQIDTMAKYVEFIRGLKGDKGDTAITYVTDGVLALPSDLPADAVEGHGYLVGNDADDYEFYVYVAGQWVNLGNDIGPAGPAGVDGPEGKPMTPKGTLPNVGALPTEDNEVGDTYAIGSEFHSWNGTAWINFGDFAGPVGPEGPDGPVGPALTPKGSVATVGDLPDSGSIKGDAYEIVGNLHVYDGAAFIDMGPWRGPIGLTGKSAYQSAVDGGFVGNEAAWRLSLKGEKGDTGEVGPTGSPMKLISVLDDEGDLPAGAVIADTYMIGDSYYVWNGADWTIIPALKGTDGRSLTFVGDFVNQAALPVGQLSQVATAAGRIYIHDGAAWIDSGVVGVKGDKGDTGDQGKSAYQVAVDGGFVGTNIQWLASLKGDTGDTGKSLYQDAVDTGAFVGTLPEFIASQKGATGRSAFQEAIVDGKLPPDATVDDFLELIQGPVGETGSKGDTGQAISIIGTLATEAELPTPGVVGTGYAIPDAATPGVYDCWIWLSATNAWFNLGHVVGSQGPKGDQGTRGIQGVKGEQGIQGSLWLVFGRNPQAQDGRIGDYFYNNQTQEFFRKNSAVVWDSLGHIGGGNLNAPALTDKFKGYQNSDWVDLPLLNSIVNDDKNKVVKNGAWVDAPLLNTIPVNDAKFKAVKDGEWADLTLLNSITALEAGAAYQLVNGAWVKFDTYTLKVLDAVIAANATTLDWNLARQFRIVNNTAGAKTVNLTNIPGADRATSVVVKIYGKTAVFNWTIPAGKGTLRWADGTPPPFANDTTTVVFNWDGQELVGFVPN